MDDMNKTGFRRKSREETKQAVMALLLGEDNEANCKPYAEQNPSCILHISDLVPFVNHPFKLYEGARLDDLVRSIKELGIIVPIIARPLDEDEGTYEILSGHNRVNAAKLAGLSEVPATVKTGLTDEEAELIVTETNLMQRSFADLTYAQRAIAIKRHMDAVRKQGRRTDLINEIKRLSNPDESKEIGTSCQDVVKPPRSNEQVGEAYQLSPRNVARYVRISYLSEPLTSRLDHGEIAFIPAVMLSYLSMDEQALLNQLLHETSFKIDMKKADILHKLSDTKKLTMEKMRQVLSGELNKKPKSKTVPPLKIKAKIYQKYFDSNTTQSEMETIIDQALEEYFQNHKKEDIA